MRLWLLGDDEALDILAELSRHLEYFQVARLDDARELEEVLGADDHVVTQRPDAPQLETAGLVVGLSTDAADSPGARAITAASALVAARRHVRGQS